MNSAADQPRTRVVPSRLSTTTTTKLSGSVTDIELKLFRKKIKKAMQCSQVRYSLSLSLHALHAMLSLHLSLSLSHLTRVRF
jgi:hypothetical protein